MFFKFKDVFTLLNLLLALIAVMLSIEGNIEWAAFIVLLSWLLDGLDGFVAKVTQTANKFGAEFDNLVDLFSFSIVPGFIIYAAYRNYSKHLAIALCFFVIAVGTIRLARFNTKPLSVPGYWIGFPRPASGLFIAFLMNSIVFSTTLLHIPAAIVIVLVGFLNLTYLPYKSNKAKLTNFQTFLVFLAPISSMLLHPLGYMWDVALLWMILYIFSPWVAVPKLERAEIRLIIDKWKQNS